MSENSLYQTEDGATPKKVDKPSKSEPTLLDRLREKISTKVERPPVYLEIPERKGVTLKINPNITQVEMRRWRKLAGEESKNGMDATKFACQVIGQTTIGVCIDDQEVFDGDGYPLTFSSSEILEMTETTRPLPDAVRAFFGVDPHLEAAALAILDAAGYGDTVDTVDPTRESSTI